MGALGEEAVVMTARLVDVCEVCGGPVREVLSLGSSPPTCVMQPVGTHRPEMHYPLDLMFCEACDHGQLSVFVDPDVQFPLDYPYASGNSAALHADFEDLEREIETLLADGLLVDIGANDGTLLSKFGGRTFGVEPTDQAHKIAAPHIQAFFTGDIARDIVAEHGKAKVITACNVLAHVDHLAGTMRAIDTLLADDGYLVAECHDLRSVVDGQWDTVYHEHLRYFSPYSFSRMLRRYGMRVRSCEAIPTHGGSFRIVAQRDPIMWVTSREEYDFGALAAAAEQVRYELRNIHQAGQWWGIGATARATTVINYCGLDVEDIAAVAEVPGSEKIGRYIPGTRIPVVDERELLAANPPTVVLFSWHLADVIVPKLREQGYFGEIVLPLDVAGSRNFR